MPVRMIHLKRCWQSLGRKEGCQSNDLCAGQGNVAYRARQRVYCEPRASGKDRTYTSLPDVARAFARKRLGLDLDGAPAGATCWKISARACCLCCMLLYWVLSDSQATIYGLSNISFLHLYCSYTCHASACLAIPKHSCATTYYFCNISACSGPQVSPPPAYGCHDCQVS